MLRNNMHRELDAVPLAYFITIRTYGTWLHGDQRGWVDKEHNVYGTARRAPDADIQEQARRRMQGEAFVLDGDGAALVEKTLREVCEHRKWLLRVINVRTNHVHAVVSANSRADLVLNALKGNATRQLREDKLWLHPFSPWAHKGSKIMLWTERSVANAIDYVLNCQAEIFRTSEARPWAGSVQGAVATWSVSAGEISTVLTPLVLPGRYRSLY